jgi:hypothetical protein
MRNLIALPLLLGLWLAPLNQDFAFAQKGPKVKDASFQKDKELFHFLLSHRDEIVRQVKNLPNGVETVTESDNPQVAGKIKEHVASMHQRVKSGNPIHLRDPLFYAIFQNYDKIEMAVTPTPKGVKVVETSKDAYAAKLIQAHAQVVSLFLANGHAEVQKNHAVPKK